MTPKKKSVTRRKNSAKNAGLTDFVRIQIYAFIIYILVFIGINIISVSADLSQKYVYYMSLCFIFVSSFLTAFISGVKFRRNGLVTGVLYALPMNLLVILISLISSGFKPDINILISLFMMIVASAAGGIVSVNIKVRK